MDFAPIFAAVKRARHSTAALKQLLKYGKYGQATDALVGRMLACLDPQTPEFAAVMPRFVNEDKWRGYMAQLFGAPQTSNVTRIQPRLLAVLIYHYEFLQTTLPETHPLRGTPLFQWSLELVESMANNLTMEVEEGTKVHGVPISIKLLEENKQLRKEVATLHRMLKDIADKQDELTELIPLSAAASGNLAGERQLQRLQEDIAQAVVDRLGSANTRAAGEEGVPTTTGLQNGGYPNFMWGGKIRGVPNNFSLNRGEKLHVVWRKWWGGDGNTMPYRIILSKWREDIVDAATLRGEGGKKKQVRAAINEQRQVMAYLTKLLPSVDVDVLEDMNACAVSTMAEFQAKVADAWGNVYPKLVDAIGFNCAWRSESGGGSTKRRKHDISRTSVRTIYRLILEEKKSRVVPGE